jgi:hypothetical protein
MNVGHAEISVADLGCLSQIPHPNFSIEDPRSRILDPGSQIKGKEGTGSRISDPGSGSATKNVSILTRIPDFFDPDPGVKKALGPGP